MRREEQRPSLGSVTLTRCRGNACETETWEIASSVTGQERAGISAHEPQVTRLCYCLLECGSAVCSGIMLHAGRSLVRDPMPVLFQFTLFFQLHYSLGVCSAATRNEYQKQKINIFFTWGVEPGRCVRLTTSSLSADYLDSVGFSTDHNPIGLHGLLRG
jgi:hypothetical protein